jgi:hypothetical protein
MERLIGIYSSAPRCGKTFAAAILAHNNFQPLSFAEPIKRMTVEFLESLGYSRDKSISLAWVDKESVVPEIGLSSRYIQQTLGTEWGRTLVDSEIWVTSLKIRAKRFDRIVVDDVRFENEANAIKEMGGEMWFIRRPSVMINSDHASDGALDKWTGFDHFIQNDGTLHEFREKINALI